MMPLTWPVSARFALVALVVATAIGLHQLVPGMPRFLALLPAVLIASFFGGPWLGGTALVVVTGYAVSDLYLQDLFSVTQAIALACFLASGVLAIGLMQLHHHTVARLSQERRRLQAALAAASAGVWEITPDGKLFWDENFYRLVGLEPKTDPPSSATFLSMIHPEDREKMSEARRLMDTGKDPPRLDEYRLTRRDGETVWLENHRARVSQGGDYFIGVTQDVTRRKLAEERVRALLSEAEHRARNQFAVIMAIARETRRASEGQAEFEKAFAARLLALSRSHELLVKGDWRGASLRALAAAHLDSFTELSRYRMEGPEIVVMPAAAQYLGMAFHELATNSMKHGALAAAGGSISVAWEVSGEGGDGQSFSLTWAESGGAAASAAPHSDGFGTKVLLQVVPAALGGSATREIAPDGLRWTLTAPVEGVVEADKRGSAAAG